MLIRDRKLRDKRSEEKIDQVLQFLKQETYSNHKNLCLLMGYKTRNPLDRLLAKLVQMELIKKHIYQFQTGQIAIWGITANGQMRVFEGEKYEFPEFEPVKLSFVKINHHLDNQIVRMTLESKGWRDWQHGDRKAFIERYDVECRPDATLVHPQGNVVAIETERTPKTKARYQKIIASHLVARKKKLWDMVIYACPDEKTKQFIERRFNSIEYIFYHNEKVKLDASHRKTFRFLTFDEIKAL